MIIASVHVVTNRMDLQSGLTTAGGPFEPPEPSTVTFPELFSDATSESAVMVGTVRSNERVFLGAFYQRPILMDVQMRTWDLRCLRNRDSVRKKLRRGSGRNVSVMAFVGISSIWLDNHQDVSLWNPNNLNKSFRRCERWLSYQEGRKEDYTAR